MNLILLFPQDFIDHKRVRLQGRRQQHIKDVHQGKPGDSFCVGMINGKIGQGILETIDEHSVELRITLHRDPPKALPITLIVALPRPKMLKRILQTIATMGVKKLIFINSVRVEKSYWQTPILQEKNLLEHLTLGLEQARDTVMPEIILEKRFKPFVEDRLASIISNQTALVAHPNLGDYCSGNYQSTENATATTLAVGPEGGFIPYEIDKLIDCGFKGIHLGERILRVETAIPVLLAKLF